MSVIRPHVSVLCNMYRLNTIFTKFTSCINDRYVLSTLGCEISTLLLCVI